MAYQPIPSKAEDSAHASGDLGVMGLAVRKDTRGTLADTDGDYAPPQLNASGDVRVDGSAVTQPVGGTAAHDAAISGNPVRLGARAASADLTAVAAGDAVDLVADLTGRLIVGPYALPGNFVSGVTSDITGTADTAVIAAQGAGVRIYVTHIVVQNSHATVNTWVNIKSATTVRYSVYAAAVGGGASITLPVPLQLTANEALNCACVTTGANVRVSASGYKGV